MSTRLAVAGNGETSRTTVLCKGARTMSSNPTGQAQRATKTKPERKRRKEKEKEKRKLTEVKPNCGGP